MTEKKSQPLLPVKLSRDVAEEVRGFVSTFLYARKSDTSRSILKCLFEDDPIIKGPFLSLNLPFVTVNSSKWPLDEGLDPGYASYVHQTKAYERLSSGSPKNTLITTGTGSGKSECFILPILNYVLECKRSGKKDGVKALIMYPMNALIDDQGERLSELANKLNLNLPKEQHIRIGRYTGDHGDICQHDPNNPKLVINNRDEMCQNPPDVLLTNYRMLDFMLFRPEEQRFWKKATQDVFRYLCLDELHTFDGAQGADVACLIRRLRLKVKSEFTCVGTSATVAGGNSDNKESKELGLKKLCEFATTLFGSELSKECVLVEEQVSPKDFMSEINGSINIPKQPKECDVDLRIAGTDGYERYTRDLCEHFDAPEDVVERGEWILKHPLTNKILQAPVTGAELNGLASDLKVDPLVLGQFFDLLASARKKIGSRLGPVLRINSQLWVSESNMLLRKIDPEPQFKRELTENEKNDFLPAVHCDSCGLSGWVGRVEQDEANEQFLCFSGGVDAARTDFFAEKGIILFPRCKSSDDDLLKAGYYVYDTETERLIPEAYKTNTPSEMPLHAAFMDNTVQSKFIPTKRGKKSKELNRCPSCDTALSLRLSSIGSSMIGSVLAGAFLSHGANPSDKKLLIFNDSVQDAAHQAGYISARGFRFNLRRFMVKMLEILTKDSSSASGFSDFHKVVSSEVSNLWLKARENDRTAKFDLMQIIPKDLWELWKAKVNILPLNNTDFRDQLIDRLSWECWFESTVNREYSWSLRRSGLFEYEIFGKTLDVWAEEAKNAAIRTQFGDLEDPKIFAWGLAQHLIRKGIIFHPELKQSYDGQRQFSTYLFTRNNEHLAPLFSLGHSKPQVLKFYSRKHQAKSGFEVNLTGGTGTTWIQKWAQRCHKKTSATAAEYDKGKCESFLERFIEAIIGKGIRLGDPEKEHHETGLVVDDQVLRFTSDEAEVYSCKTCSHRQAVNLSIDLVNAPCVQYLCKGYYDKLEDDAERSYRDYLSLQYRRPIFSAFSHSHTGQLNAKDRREVEQAFKRDLLPGDSMNESGKGTPLYRDHPINILTCTPTMEMGIDIGSLSGVVLRGFPRTLSNTLQRLGRSGRSSGNSFDMIMATRKAHDRYHWTRPEMIFKGDVAPPGCRFRTKDILKRQFHAYLFDRFVEINEDVIFPNKKSLGTKNDFAAHPTWQRFKLFLSECDRDFEIKRFIGSVMLGDVENDSEKSESFKTDLKVVFDGDKSLWNLVLDVLNDQTSSLKQAQLGEVTVETAAGNRLASKDLTTENPYTSDTAEADRLKSTYKNRQNRIGDVRYTFSVLGERGILPNYAFPEAGIRMDGAITVPSGKYSAENKQKGKKVKIEISRPATNGLRELAPGSSYYTDGFKVPVVRIEKPESDAEKDINRKIVCTNCGTVSPHEGNVKDKAGECPACKCHEEQDICNILDFKKVYGTGHFLNLQIRDQEENREPGLVKVEPHINFVESSNTTDDEEYATWVSTSHLLAFEFRKNAEIHFLNRGQRGLRGEPSYFKICSQCWAVPYSIVDEIATFKRDFDINRHAFTCNHYQNPNNANVEILTVALGKSIRSDAIRFYADDYDSSKTLVATLQLAMKIHLGGSSQHLRIASSILETRSQQSKNVVITLYDDIPGGTGHLTALMPPSPELFKKKGGLDLLVRAFKKTQIHIQECPCSSTNGCYKCLLSADNQYSHDAISKVDAIKWLGRFVKADDWDIDDASVNVAVGNREGFDSELEIKFFDSLFHRYPGVSGVKRVRRIDNASLRTAELIDLEGGGRALVSATPHQKVNFASGGYTKPDFTIRKDGNIAGYIYTDGKQYHLDSENNFETFYQDFYLRNQLSSQIPAKRSMTPVLSLSFDMVDAWATWVAERKPSEYQTNESPNKILFDGANSEVCVLVATLKYVSKCLDLSKDKVDEMFNRLYVSYVRDMVGDLAGLATSPFYSESKKQSLEANVKKLPDFEFGCLKKLADGDALVEFDPELFKYDENGKPTTDAVRSWELFWILWGIDQSWVSLKQNSKISDISIKNELPKGYEYLDEGKETDVVNWLIENKKVTHCVSEIHELLGLFGQCLAYEPETYVLFREEDLEVSKGDIPSKTSDGSKIIVIDLDQIKLSDLESLIPS